MSPTHDMIIDNSTGANVRADINNALAALVSNSSSSSEPSTKYAYMWWADTNTGILKIRNSSNNAWVELLQLDGTLTLEDGSNSAPSLGFRDDLDTGIFSSAANNLDITTGGTTRVNVSSTGINVTGTVTDDGATHDGDVTFTGASANITFDKSEDDLIFNDNAKAVFGTLSDGLEIFHDGTTSRIKETGTGDLTFQSSHYDFLNLAGDEYIARLFNDAQIELYYDSSKRFETTSSGTLTTGVLAVNDATSATVGNRIAVGTSQDLKIYHIGGNDSYIRNATGDTYLQGNNSGTVVNNIKFENSDGSTELFFNGSKKLATLTDGVDITGTLKVNGSAFTSGGKVLQVVQKTDSTVYNTTSQSYQQATQSDTITLNNSSNKVLVIVNFMAYADSRSSGHLSVAAALFRGSVSSGTQITSGTQPMLFRSSGISTEYYNGFCTLMFLDTPGGNTTYSLGFKQNNSSGSEAYIFGSQQQTVMILQEIEQ